VTALYPLSPASDVQATMNC